MNDIFQISILIIKKKLKSLSSAEKEQLKDLSKRYPFTKEIDFVSLVDKVSEHNTLDKDKAWDHVLHKSQKRQSTTRTLIYRQTWFKYAASITLLLSLTLAYNKFKHPKVEIPVSVNPVNNVVIGTDKATLTLANGTNIALEKGKNYQDANVSSNGEAIVYNHDEESNAIKYNFLTIPRGGQFYVELSDGTKVWLNSDSQLKFPVSFVKDKSREVELVYGEAYFEVSPSTEHNGADFKVFHNKQEIKVLGTQFNLKAYKDETNVYTTLVEGKIAVQFEGNKQTLLPSQQSNLNLNNNLMAVATVDVYNEISWKEGVFSFNGKPLKDIMKVLERWYDIEVVFKNQDILNEEFNGILGKDQKIEEILNYIKNFGKIKAYEIQDKKLILE